MEPLLLCYKSVHMVGEGVGCLVFAVSYDVHTVKEKAVTQWIIPFSYLGTPVEAKEVLWLAELVNL